MTFVDSIIIEYEQAEAVFISEEILNQKKEKLKAFYCELHQVYRHSGKFVLKYIFYILKKKKRCTPLQMQKQFKAISPNLSSLTPQELEEQLPYLREKEVVLYRYPTEKNIPDTEDLIKDYLLKNELPHPVLEFTEAPQTPQGSLLTELGKAVFLCHKRKALLLITHSHSLLENPLFYSILSEYDIQVRSVDFSWICPKNLKLMQAMVLFKQVK